MSYDKDASVISQGGNLIGTIIYIPAAVLYFLNSPSISQVLWPFNPYKTLGLPIDDVPPITLRELNFREFTLFPGRYTPNK